MPAGGCDSPRTPGPEGFPGLQYERSTTDRQPDSRPGRPAPSRPQAGIYQRRDASRPHESEGDLQRPAGEKHRRGLGDVRQGVVAAGKWHGVKVQRTVAQPNHQRANSRRDRRSGRQPNRQPSNHLRSAVLSPLPHQCRCHDSQHTQEPQQHKWRDEEVLGFAARYSCTRSPARVMATTAWIGGAIHAHRPPTNTPVADRPSITNRTARVRDVRGAPEGSDGPPKPGGSVTAVSPSRPSPPARGENSAPTSRRAGPGRPSGDRTAHRTGGAPDPSEPLSAWPYPPVPRCTRCTRRQRPERVVFQPRFPPFTGWR